MARVAAFALLVCLLIGSAVAQSDTLKDLAKVDVDEGDVDYQQPQVIQIHKKQTQTPVPTKLVVVQHQTTKPAQSVQAVDDSSLLPSIPADSSTEAPAVGLTAISGAPIPTPTPGAVILEASPPADEDKEGILTKLFGKKEDKDSKEVPVYEIQLPKKQLPTIQQKQIDLPAIPVPKVIKSTVPAPPQKINKVVKYAVPAPPKIVEKTVQVEVPAPPKEVKQIVKAQIQAPPVNLPYIQLPEKTDLKDKLGRKMF